MGGDAPVPAVELRHAGAGGEAGGARGAVTVTVRLRPLPVYDAVTVVTPQQLRHGDHRHVLLHTEVGVDDPGPLATNVHDDLGGHLLQTVVTAAVVLRRKQLTTL